MRASLIRVLVVACIVARSADLNAQAAPTLTLVAETGESKVFKAAELAALPQVEATAAHKGGTPSVFRGPTVRSLMTLVGAPTAHALRGPAMLLAVVTDAADGYRVAFMLAEIDPQFGARMAILALTKDGHPLSDADGPFRVIVAEDEHGARWIRHVTRLRLVKVSGD